MVSFCLNFLNLFFFFNIATLKYGFILKDLIFPPCSIFIYNVCCIYYLHFIIVVN